MKSPLIIGNWKSHKSVAEAESYFGDLAAEYASSQEKTVVFCPPYPLLDLCRSLIKKHQLNWQLGAQDVSAFPMGKHTGEVNAKLLKDFVSYVLIGHSERRAMGETDDVLLEKVKRVREAGLTPIYFVPDENAPIPEEVEIVAYEPVFAIGTGNPDTPEDAEKVALHLKSQKYVSTVLYGGSVDDKNVNLFMSCSSIDGIVPGTASLDPIVFARLVHNA